jgi:hypothetical protein
MMPPISSLKNQYQGINPHLHSYFQAKGGWATFHTEHIVHLSHHLKRQLLPMGYTTQVEQSLQIRRVDNRMSRPRADVAIFDRDPHRPTATPLLQRRPASMTFAELLDEPELSEARYRAIEIMEYDPETMENGQPVAWLELLSPSNKGNSEDANAYRAKRMDILVQGLVFIEIDYLHETPPSFHTLGNYPAEDSFPYRIIVIDPRPVLEDGPVQVAAFAVDERIPVLDIPLNRSEFIPFDFGIPYQETYNAGLYGVERVDYSKLPLNFDQYSRQDQIRIVRRMLAVIEAAKNGEDLEMGMFPIEDISLEEALRRIEAF